MMLAPKSSSEVLLRSQTEAIKSKKVYQPSNRGKPNSS